MIDPATLSFLRNVLNRMPADWLNLTTHRLDIYEEPLAKVQFLEKFEALARVGNAYPAALSELPTAYDYVRLGHPLSCILEWTIGKAHSVDANQVISFSSATMPLLALLRKNLLDGRDSRIVDAGGLPEAFDADLVRRVYGYRFEVVTAAAAQSHFAGSTIVVTRKEDGLIATPPTGADFHLTVHPGLGSVLLINGAQNADYVGAVQHVRRRESIAMTPVNCLTALRQMIGEPTQASAPERAAQDLATVRSLLRDITATQQKPLLGSSGLSVQYAIMMGLIDEAAERHPGKAIKIVVPPNCYGGTNDQARRVAACNDNVAIVDLPVDGDNDMVRSVDAVLTTIAAQDAVPYIIAEIPTNPRVEVPDLAALKAVLERKRTTPDGAEAVGPVFILDQTFCPNVHFLGKGDTLSTVRAVSYSSGSKFPSGGRCTAGYCVGNQLAEGLMRKVDRHLQLCDNEATDHQLAILTELLPSMNERIAAAYANTRAFVDFIAKVLPTAKINFVSEELAAAGFTPSVFSLNLPTKGDTAEERETYKRSLNLKLIRMMIGAIPEESKFCVSYGQLKGCYWTVPATSTQGTTREGDKDYIVRVSVSPKMDLARHQEVFLDFCRRFAVGVEEVRV